VDTTQFTDELKAMIRARKKMTSRLYRVILAGDATERLLQQFIVNRYPIKNLWTRNILGIAARVDDYKLRCELVENIYEEETGRLTGSKRHLQSFVDVGLALLLTEAQIVDAPLLPETRAVMEHNVGACNANDVHFTVGVASVLLLMEGQPPILSQAGSSMEAVMRDVYRLPPSGYDFFSHHASSGAAAAGVSPLEDDHADCAVALLRRYCTTDALQAQARAALARAIELRHEHFDAMYEKFYVAGEPPFRYSLAA
jgi:pyrroloquinoline-quinone synthase